MILVVLERVSCEDLPRHPVLWHIPKMAWIVEGMRWESSPDTNSLEGTYTVCKRTP